MAKWFIQGSAFDEWKKNGSLLWIRGNRYVSLFPLSLSWVFNYFSGYQRGQKKVSFFLRLSLKTSSIFKNRDQLWSSTTTLTSRMLPNLLSQLHKKCRDGSEQRSEAMLVRCLVADALDECPNNTEIPSAREKVLTLCLKFALASAYVTAYPERYDFHNQAVQIT